MPGRYFLDTNIFVYSFDSDSGAKCRRATELIREAVDSRRGIVSYQVVQEFFNVALRRFAEPMLHGDAEQYLTTVFRPLLALHSSIALYQEALVLSHRYRLSWFDSLILAAALAGECDVLYSEDLQDGQEFGGLQVKNPFA
jgi:predicted nucleic acid-binding protein